jgi:hypothetical protein
MDSGAWKWSIWPGASAAVTLGRLTRPSVYAGDVIFECVGAGTTGLAEPAWDLTVGHNTVDGGVTWQAVAYAVGAGKFNPDGDTCDEIYHTNTNRLACPGILRTGAGRALQIAGYYDGLLVPGACATCWTGSLLPVWDGKLYRRYCYHAGQDTILDYSLPNPTQRRVSNNFCHTIRCFYMCGTAAQGYLSAADLPPSGFFLSSDFVWLFSLFCQTSGTTSALVGAWSKPCHNRNPAGVYTKIAGLPCTTPDTITMELYTI